MIFLVTGPARDFRVRADEVKRARQNCHGDGACPGAVRVGAGVVVALAAGDGADDQPHEEQHCADSHFCLRERTFRWVVYWRLPRDSGQRRVLRRGTDHFVPTPARWRARQASPTSIRLVGEKTALVAVDVALIKNAMMNRTAAAKPSICRILPGRRHRRTKGGPGYRKPVGQTTRWQAAQARIKVNGRAIAPTALSYRQRRRSAAREIPNAAMHYMPPGAGSDFRELPGSGTAIYRLLVLELSVQDTQRHRHDGDAAAVLQVAPHVTSEALP